MSVNLAWYHYRYKYQPVFSLKRSQASFTNSQHKEQVEVTASATAPSAFDAWLKHSARHSVDFAATAVSYINREAVLLFSHKGETETKEMMCVRKTKGT